MIQPSFRIPGTGMPEHVVARIKIDESRAALERVKARLTDEDAKTLVRALDCLGGTTTARDLVQMLARVIR